MTDAIPLAEACQRLHLSWNRTWNLVLTGVLAGEKVNGRWFVARADVEREYARRNSAIGRAAAAELLRGDRERSALRDACEDEASRTEIAHTEAERALAGDR